MSSEVIKPEPTRARVYTGIKRTATAGGLSIAAIMGVAIPWANAQSTKLDEVRSDVVLCKSSLEESRLILAQATVRTTALEVSRAAADTLSNTYEKRLDRIESKLDRIIERLK